MFNRHLGPLLNHFYIFRTIEISEDQIYANWVQIIEIFLKIENDLLVGNSLQMCCLFLSRDHAH